MENKVVYHKVLPVGEFKTWSSRPGFPVVRTRQIHSKDLLVYTGESLEETEADGVVFKFATLQTKKTAVAVTTADCMPALFLGKEKGAFLHAGWRGLAKGILVHPMIKEIDPYFCFIGPSICADSFEVQEDFYQYFPAKNFYREDGGRLTFDLKAKAREEILGAFPEIQLEIADACTLRDLNFHSHRANGTKERNWNIFSL